MMTIRELFRLNGAVERDPAIDGWMKEHAGELGAIAQKWLEVMRKCGDEVRELLHDGCPVACLGDAPFGYVKVFTSHVNVGFFHGGGTAWGHGLLCLCQECCNHTRRVRSCSRGEPFSDYSAHNACMGSTFEARAAGSHTASRAIAARMSGADTKTAGSQGLTPKRNKR